MTFPSKDLFTTFLKMRNPGNLKFYSVLRPNYKSNINADILFSKNNVSDVESSSCARHSAETWQMPTADKRSTAGDWKAQTITECMRRL